jgi:hypothetical protein
MIGRRWWLAVLACLAARPAAADEEPPWVDIHAFGSQGFILSTGNDYIDEDSKRGSFRFTEVGLNVSKQLTERLSFGVQVFAQNVGPAGTYVPQIDWFYLDYRWRDWAGLRVGRSKIPYGFYNESNDIDSSRVPILLPQGLYPLQARQFLFAQTGAQLYGFARSRWAGALDYRFYGGTIDINPSQVVPVGTPAQLKFNVPYAFGGRVIWETPLPGLRLAVSGLQLRMDVVAFLGMGMMAGIVNHSRSWVASGEYAFHALAITAEYGRGSSKQDSLIPTSNFEVTSDSWYVMVSYAALPWLQPATYYSLKFPDVTKRDGLENKQRDLALSLRFDINRYWLFKLEGHYMAGTAGLVNPVRFGPPPADPAFHWGVFLVKTTVYF